MKLCLGSSLGFDVVQGISYGHLVLLQRDLKYEPLQFSPNGVMMGL